MRTAACRRRGDKDMAITISLPSRTEKRLRARASQNGVDVSVLAGQLIEKEIQRPCLSEILAPLRKQVRESGISDEALTVILEDAREEAWQERQEAEPEP